MKRRSALPALLFLAALTGLVSACGEDIDPVDKPISVHATHYEIGGYKEGARRILIIEGSPDNGSPVDGPDPEFTVRGRLRTSSVDWVKDKCGPVVYWEFYGTTAERYAADFYRDLPLHSIADVDEFLEAKGGWRAYEGEGFPPPPTGPQPAFPMWEVDLHSVPNHLWTHRNIEVWDTVSEVVLASVADLNTKVEPYVLWFPAEVATQPNQSGEALRYIEDFGDQLLRTYLEKNKPRCLRG